MLLFVGFGFQFCWKSFFRRTLTVAFVLGSNLYDLYDLYELYKPIGGNAGEGKCILRTTVWLITVCVFAIG